MENNLIRAIAKLAIWIPLLIFSADILVKWASSLAKKLGISALMIWLTIVAFGTSAPELAINIIAAFKGHTELALSNVLGSNIANILLILWVAAIIYPIKIQSDLVRKEIPFNFIITLILAFLILDKLAGYDQNIVTWLDAWVLLSIFWIYFMYLLYQFIKQKNSNHLQQTQIASYSPLISLVMILWWAIWLALGGEMIVQGATSLAYLLKIPSEVIGATVLAIGTSLPELAVSILAALKKHSDIAVGNAIGSNIFNILWILGLTWLINPLPWYPLISIDLTIAGLASLLLLAFAFWFEKYKITRGEGIFMIALYIAYLGFLTFKTLYF